MGHYITCFVEHLFTVIPGWGQMSLYHNSVLCMCCKVKMVHIEHIVRFFIHLCGKEGGGHGQEAIINFTTDVLSSCNEPLQLKPTSSQLSQSVTTIKWVADNLLRC